MIEDENGNELYYEVKFLLRNPALAIHQPGYYLLRDDEVVDGPFATEQEGLDEIERLENA